MATRWSVGPAFIHEWRLASRRRRLYVMRSLFVLLLLLVLLLTGWETWSNLDTISRRRQARSEERRVGKECRL